MLTTRDVATAAEPILELDDVGKAFAAGGRTTEVLTGINLSIAAGEIRAAEGYLLELLAWCAFADREAAQATDDDLL